MSLSWSLPPVVSFVSLATLLTVSCSSPSTDSDSDAASGSGTPQPTDSAGEPGQAADQASSDAAQTSTGPTAPVQDQSAGADVDPNAIVVDRPEDVAQQAMETEVPIAEAEVSTMVNEECASTAVEAVDTTAVQPADIVIAIDSSFSMGEEIEFVQTYMNQFSQQIVDSGIDVRVILIGNPPPPTMDATGDMMAADMPTDDMATDDMMTDDGTADGMPGAGMPGAGGGFGGGGFAGGGLGAQHGICIDAPLGSGSCPDDENLPLYAHVTNQVGSNDVLNVIIDTFPEWQQHLRPEASKSIVIVSDDDATDEPNNSAATFTQNFQALSPDLFAEWTFNGIFCGMECPPLSAAVGTVFQDLVTQTGGVAGELCEQDFQPVFDRLAEQIITQAGSEIACEWELPPAPPGQTFSVDLVEVTRTTMASGSVAFNRVASEAECGPNSWHFDDALNPTKILACPETCEAMQGEDGGGIGINFSCEVIEGCAASSSSDVGLDDAAGGCEFPLPAPPEGVILDVETVNVRYATPSGFGVVLGVVPSADECANVDGGWYFDDAEEPTSITLCPTTCTAYEGGTVTNVQALFGCAQKPAERISGPR